MIPDFSAEGFSVDEQLVMEIYVSGPAAAKQARALLRACFHAECLPGYDRLQVKWLPLSGRCGSANDSLLQNSSIISAERKPQRYLPLKRLSSPTQDLRPSVAGAMRWANSGVLQFKMTATSVRPACAN